MVSGSAVSSNCTAKTIARQVGPEVFYTCRAAGYEGAVEALEGLRPLWAEGFGPVGTAPAASLAATTPATWVTSQSYVGEGLGGKHLHALSGAVTRPLHVDGRLVGMAWDGPQATECYLAGLYAADVTLPRPEQARRTFELMDTVLGQEGMDFHNVVRTWLFLDDILDWYGEFNVVRTTFFKERGVFDGLVPASTGIGGSNPAGAAMTTGLYAVKPHSSEVAICAVPSPLQCPALQYGSSFSRATEVRMADVQRLLISGTASIDPDGHTQYVGDTAGQIARTCEVVAAILHSRGLDWADVTRATAYYRDSTEVPLFSAHWATTGLAPLPVVHAANVICRHDLLFELEVDAVRAL